MALTEERLLELAVDITVSAISGESGKSIRVAEHPEKATDYVEFVFSKLKKINDCMQ